MEKNTQLNKKQTHATIMINDFISQNDNKVFYLLGYAGTGKTFLIGHIIKNLLSMGVVNYFYVCSPTHQALNVIESSIKCNISEQDQSLFEKKIKFMTIHKLLEFKPTFNVESGVKIFKSIKESKYLKHLDNKIIIIDECSMISKDMLDIVNKYIKLYPMKVIFMGDDKQLPPVSESESMIFATIPKNYKYCILLDQVMRTKSNNIRDVCTYIREWNTRDNIISNILEIHNKKNTFYMFHKKKDFHDSSCSNHL